MIVILTDNLYLKSGIVNFLSKLYFPIKVKKKIILFTLDYYYKALEVYLRCESDCFFCLVYSFNDFKFQKNSFIDSYIYEKSSLLDWYNLFNAAFCDSQIKNNSSNVNFNYVEVHTMISLSNGLTVSQIASATGIAKKTIYSAKRSALRKLNCKSKIEFVRLCTFKPFRIWLKLHYDTLITDGIGYDVKIMRDVYKVNGY